MPCPSIVVFDLGKVLVDFDYAIAARRVAARSAMPPEVLQDFLSRSPSLLRFEVGQLTRQEFFDEVLNATGFRGTIEEFSKFFADIFNPIPAMVDIHAALRRRGMPAYVFSNTNDIAIEHIRENFPFYQDFDGYILSYEVGAMKPDGRIYEALERMAGRCGSDVLYIDDRPENVAAGAARGWQAILHESPETTRIAMEKTGILPSGCSSTAGIG